LIKSKQGLQNKNKKVIAKISIGHYLYPVDQEIRAKYLNRMAKMVNQDSFPELQDLQRTQDNKRRKTPTMVEQVIENLEYNP